MPQFSRLSSRSSLTVSERRKRITAAVRMFQGTVSGYTSGANSPNSNIIDKFPFATNSSASDVGDLTQFRGVSAGQSSDVSGYTSGGPGPVDTIDKFPFASDGNATDVGDLTVARRNIAGQSSADNGYVSGGRYLSGGLGLTIDKFPFASDANATDVGDLTVDRGSVAGQTSSENGYTSGGTLPPGSTVNTIDKFPFASNANATDVGDLSQGRGEVAGQSSTESGYTSGGGATPSPSPRFRDTIDKFPFASDANATDVGDLSQRRSFAVGQSSTTSGYSSGGQFPTGPNTSSRSDFIDKFPFASNSNASEIGRLTSARYHAAGQQV